MSDHYFFSSVPLLKPFFFLECHSHVSSHLCFSHLNAFAMPCAMGASNLPLQELNHMLLLLTSNTPLKEFEVKSRNESLFSGKTGSKVFRQIFFGADFMSPTHLSPHI